MRAICSRIARVAQAASDRLEAATKARAASPSTNFIDTPAPTPTTSNGAINLSFVALPPLDRLDADVQPTAEVRIFWQHLRVLPIDTTTGVGVTWLELHALFSLRGGNAIGKPSVAKEHLRQTHAASYNAFFRRSKQLFGFADEATKPLLKPHLVRHAGNRQPLARYGMLGNFSQLPFQLQLGDSLLHAALCAHGGKVHSAARIPLRLRSTHFKAPRFAPWQHLVQAAILPEAAKRLIARGSKMQQVLGNDATISSYDQQLASDARRSTDRHMHHVHSATQQVCATTDAPNEFLLQCRSCNVKSNLARRTLYSRGKCMHIICHACGKGASAARWLCNCGSAWIACQNCRPIGFQCRSSTVRPKKIERKQEPLTSKPVQSGPKSKRACLRGGTSLALYSSHPTPKRRRPRPSFSAVLRGRANLGLRSFNRSTSKARRTQFAPSVLTDAGCSIKLAPVFPLVAPPPIDPPCDPPRPLKLAKLGTSSNLHLISAPSTGLVASLTNSGAKRSLEDTGGDGRTPKSIKDLRASRGSGPNRFTNSTTCIRGSGLCPMTGWTIAEYCPACHG